MLNHGEEYTEEESRLYFGPWKSIWWRGSYKDGDFRKKEKVYPWMKRIADERVPVTRVESRNVQNVFRTVALDIIKCLEAEYRYHHGMGTYEQAQKAYTEAYKMGSCLSRLFVDTPVSNPNPGEILASPEIVAYINAVYGANVNEQMNNVIVWDLPRGMKDAGVFIVALLSNVWDIMKTSVEGEIAAELAAGRPNPYPSEREKDAAVHTFFKSAFADLFEKFVKGDPERVTDDGRAMYAPLIGFVPAVREAARALFSSKPSEVYGEAWDSIKETQTALSTAFGVGASIYANSLVHSRAVMMDEAMEQLAGLFEDFVRSIRRTIETLDKHGFRGNAFSDVSMKCISAAERIGRVMDDYGMSGHKY